MSESTERDPTNAGTLRPKAPPLKVKGTKFEPMDAPPFDMQLNLPPEVDLDNPLTLFLQYYTPEIVDGIIEATNGYDRPLPSNDSAPRTFLIYMTVFPLNKIEDY
ncbi:hypothetical protein ACEPPN_011426 [Leptodophora sp. 'Broadleaf-Isolate-01']